jgi:eukaryotic-like serine/threonine-protein kinase
LNALPATVPAHVRSVVARCLVKDRTGRIPDLSVARYMLNEGVPAAATMVVTSAPRRGHARIWQAATGAFALTTLVAGAAWYRSMDVTAPVATFVIRPQENMTFTAGSRVGASVPVISPDGRTVAFTARDAAGRQLLWLRRIDSVTAEPLAETDNAAFPFWSPDSRFLGYAITGKLMKVSVTGGPPQTVCDLKPGIISRGGAWSRDGVIIFNNGPAPLYRVPAAGSDATVMGQLDDGEVGRQFPAFLPDGRHFLYSSVGPRDRNGVYVGSLDNGAATRAVSSETGGAYDARNRRLLFVRHGTLLAQAFDLKTFAVHGEPMTVAEHVE